MASLEEFVQKNKSKKREGVGGTVNSVTSMFSQPSVLSQKFASWTASLTNNNSLSASNGSLIHGSDEDVSASSSSIPNGDVKNGTAGSASKLTSYFKNDTGSGLTKLQRMVGFVICLSMGLFCFGLASMYIPLLLLKARKFGALYSLGSAFFLASFGILWGPTNYVKHLFSGPKLPVTAAYFGTLIATLYASIWLRSMILTTVFCVCQIFSLLWFVLIYVPGGETGLRFMSGVASKIIKRSVSSASSGPRPTLPVLITPLFPGLCSVTCLVVRLGFALCRVWPPRLSNDLCPQRQWPQTHPSCINHSSLSRFVLSYVPGGETGLRFMSGVASKIIKRSVSSASSGPRPALPV